MAEHVAFVGTVGGVGTTRTVLELAGLLADRGSDVLVFDLDFATQGLSRHVGESVSPDATELLADPETDLETALLDWTLEGPGRLSLMPAVAAFPTIAEAKSAAAAERVGDRLDEAAEDFEWVLLDVPPVVSNQAIGAVTAVDRIVLVIPPGDRGVDALQREKGRLADVGASAEGVLAVGDGPVPPDATAAIPSLPANAPDHRPVTLEARGSFTRQVASAAEALLDTDLAVSEAGGPLETLKQFAKR